MDGRTTATCVATPLDVISLTKGSVTWANIPFTIAAAPVAETQEGVARAAKRDNGTQEGGLKR
jgi:hypothetical protein